MKINKIYLRNINSFQGEHRIDFGVSPLGTAGLFAIVGPTGAGKSTLLDAITLALFNRIPRFDKGISKNTVAAAGMILTRGERECVIEVEYSCKTGVYVSKWGIAANRNDKLNDYTMELGKAESNELLPLKKGDIPAKNQELIGLSYDQFVKSILLSQGEFARFLKSDKNERGKLLEDITGMQIYRRLGQKAHEIHKEKGRELEKLTDEINIYKREQISEDGLKERIEQEGILAKYIAEIETKKEVLEKQIELKNQLKTLQEKLENQQKVLAKVQIEWQNFEVTDGPKLQKHDRAEPFRDEVIALENTLNDFNKFKQDLLKEKELLAETNILTQQICTAIAKFCNQEITTANAIEILGDFTEKTIKLQQDLSLKNNTLSIDKKNILEIVKNIKVADLQNISIVKIDDNVLKSVQDIAQNYKQKIENLKVKTQFVDGRKIEDLLLEIEQKIPLVESLKENIEKYTSKKSELVEEEKNQKEQQEIIDLTRPKLEKVAILIEEIRGQITKLELDKEKAGRSYNFDKDRQKLLTQNEACPLCGSLEHPYLSHYANEYVEIDLQLKVQKESLKTTEKEQNTHIATEKTALGLIENASKKIVSISELLKSFLIEINNSKSLLNITESVNKQWAIDELKKLKEREKDLRQLAKDEQMVGQLRELYVKIRDSKKLQDEVLESQNEFKKIHTGQNINQESNDLRSTFIQHSTNFTQRTNRITGFEKQILIDEPVITLSQKNIENRIQQAGFEDIEYLKSQLLKPQEAQTLRQNEQGIKSQIGNINTSIGIFQKDFDEKIPQDVPEEIELLIVKQVELVEEIKVKRSEQSTLNTQILRQNELNKKIKDLVINLKIEEKNNLKWKLLNDYIGDGEGKKFSTFAQGLTLKRLIAFANERMKGLSDRYLLDKPADDEDDLMVLDLYMGNERRTVKTLSGGETFLVSLSLALALSDLASRNVKLESLFIDEGFGTLDPDTLETALSTLENLQQNDQKSIGIISHVEGIKQRIATQIVLHKNNRGFSMVKVVA